MIKFNEVKLTYTCFAAPPENVYMNRIYRIGKDVKGFFFTDGNYIEHVKENDLWYIKMLFTPNDVPWGEVDFNDSIKEVKNTIIKIEENKN